ncbi:MAG: two-component sensor histidine kinase [Firmicutes bacterium]|nr:two-component sensor histidine kinase [Bacillota bacterium]
MSFRLRLTLLYSGLFAAALLLFSLLLYGVLHWTFVQAVDNTLANVSDKVTNYYQGTGRLPPLESLGDRSTFVMIRVEDAPLVSSGNFTGLFPLPQAARNGQSVFTIEVASSGERYRLLTRPLPARNGNLYVQVAQTLFLLDATESRLIVPVGTGMLLFLVLGALGAWWLAGRALRPINNVATAARAIGESADLSLRVPYEGPEDELGVLVRTFNDMLEQLNGLYGRLAASVDAQQRFVADASHELRTPLTIIRGNIDYLQRAGRLDPEAMADMSSEAEHMTRLIEELLTMARADAGQAPEVQPVPLGPLVAEVCRKAQALPHEVEFHQELPDALSRVVVLGNAEWLSRALLILIDNAFKYTPSGSVTVRAGRQGEGVAVQVRDTGIGIAREDVPHIFERFYRADRARGRGGAGLGLAIARWVAGMHGGRLTADSEPGKGSTFNLWLPLYRGEQPPEIS